jgi:hypothetical protein
MIGHHFSISALSTAFKPIGGQIEKSTAGSVHGGPLCISAKR